MSDKLSQLDLLVSRLRDRDTTALARAISLVEACSSLATELHDRVRLLSGAAEVIGITGAPGVGKSTLINQMISAWRAREKRVAVIAVDPSSPITGGAVLGDRTRMGVHGEDPGVFIRSVAARGHLGGLSADVLCIIDLIDTAGWDVILLETVGTGQSETEISEVADINIVVNAPGLGDEVQAIKAGILEIADVLVINKVDLPLADRTERQLKAMLQLREGNSQRVPVVKTNAVEAEGVYDLLKAIDETSKTKLKIAPELRHTERARRLLAQEMAQQVKALILSGSDLDLVRDLLVRLRQREHGSDQHNPLNNIDNRSE